MLVYMFARLCIDQNLMVGLLYTDISHYKAIYLPTCIHGMNICKQTSYNCALSHSVYMRYIEDINTDLGL